MAMILIKEVGRNQYEKARDLNAPVVVTDSCTFRVPSSRPGEGDHKIQLDDPELPRAYSCTCEAGRMGTPCWAAARVLDALGQLRAANVYVSRGAASTWAALSDAESALRPATVGLLGDDLVLVWRGQQPEGGTLYSIPN